MLTRSHSNTEVKGEICFHIKIYLSYDFFQKSSCWLKNISLKVTRMRETFNSWKNYFQNFKASEAYYEEGCYFSILSRAWYKRKSPVFRIEPQNFGFAIQQEGLGRNQRLDSTWELRIFSLFHARDKKKKNHLPNSSASSKIHQVSYTSAIILFLWGITKTPGFVDNFQWFHVQKKITPTMMITE